MVGQIARLSWTIQEFKLSSRIQKLSVGTVFFFFSFTSGFENFFIGCLCGSVTEAQAVDLKNPKVGCSLIVPHEMRNISESGSPKSGTMVKT